MSRTTRPTSQGGSWIPSRGDSAAALLIAALAALACFRPLIWVIVVMLVPLVFPALGLCSVQKFARGWNQKQVNPPFDQGLEYQEASADWRHRDGLTWQMPAVLTAVAGLVVSEVYDHPELGWIRVAILVITAAFAGVLVVALRQNLILQDQDREIAETIQPRTSRFGFTRVGSSAFFRLSVFIWLVLTLIAVVECWKVLDVSFPT